MTRAATSRRLHLVVGNPEALEYGCRPSHAFGASGGTIGGRGTSWPLSDRGGRIAQLHVEIVGIDGTFCLVDRSGLTRINDAPEPLGTDRIVRLADGDHVQIGPYRLNVHIGDEDDDSLAIGYEDRSLDGILATPQWPDEGNVWPQGAEGYRVVHEPIASGEQPIDPLLALDAAAARTLDRAPEPFDATHYGLSARQDAPPDRADTMVEAFRDRHFLAATSQNATAALHLYVHRPPADAGPGVGHRSDPRILLTSRSAGRDAVAEFLRRRSDALVRHDDALLRAVDAALRGLLASTGGASAALHERRAGERDQDGVIEAFWQTCEDEYRLSMEQPRE